MATLLDDLVAFVRDCPSATYAQVRDRFGPPVWVYTHMGSYKVYTDAVFLRGGQFVHVQHREFHREQAISVREVEPMEVVAVRVSYVPSQPTPAGGPEVWAHESGLVPTGEAVLAALARDAR